LCCFSVHYTSAIDRHILTLHDALPIWRPPQSDADGQAPEGRADERAGRARTAADRGPAAATLRAPARLRGLRGGLSPGVPPSRQDRKSTRLNSSHVKTSYAVFCLKKKT